jgi:hypothetical protein
MGSVTRPPLLKAVPLPLVQRSGISVAGRDIVLQNYVIITVITSTFSRNITNYCHLSVGIQEVSRFTVQESARAVI